MPKEPARLPDEAGVFISSPCLRRDNPIQKFRYIVTYADILLHLRFPIPMQD